jgi:hypothetical protein
MRIDSTGTNCHRTRDWWGMSHIFKTEILGRAFSFSLFSIKQHGYRNYLDEEL